MEGRLRGQRLLGVATGQEQVEFDVGRVARARGPAHEHLLDARHAGQRDRPAGRGIGGHPTPARDLEPARPQRRGQGLAALRGLARVAGQEHGAGGEARAGRDAGLVGHRAQERLRAPDQQAAAIAAAAVGTDRATMGQPRQRGQGVGDQGARGTVVQVGQQAEATAVAFERGVVQAGRAGLVHAPSEARAAPGRAGVARASACVHPTVTQRARASALWLDGLR